MKNPLKYSIGSRVRDSYILNMLNPNKGTRILDLGCGIGYYCEFLSGFGAELIGCDLDFNAVFMAKELYPAYHFSINDAAHLPFIAGSFAKVLCSEVLEHIEDDATVIREMSRVIKPKGRLLITVPCIEGLFGSLIKSLGHKCHYKFERHFRKGYSIKTLKELCFRNNLKLLNYRYTMTFFVEIYMGITKLLFLLFNKRSLSSQASLKDFNYDSLLIKINALFIRILLKLGTMEDRLLSHILKGHMLIALFQKDD